MEHLTDNFSGGRRDKFSLTFFLEEVKEILTDIFW